MVKKLTWQSLFFFLVLGILGTLIRLKMSHPLLPDLNTSNLLHAHSHIAVLGWTNVAFIALIVYFTFSQKATTSRSLTIFFWAMFIVNLGIAPTFTAQGYGLYSIIFSTLSVVISIWFLVLYIKGQDRKATGKRSALYRLISTGVAFYMLSIVGLVLVAVHMAAKIGGKDLFNSAIYFYLHSQYNGWMVFALIGTVYAYLHKRGIALSERSIKWQWALLAIGFLPSYIPQIYAIQLPTWLIVVGIIGTALTVIGVLLFLKTTWRLMLPLIELKIMRFLYSYTMLAFLIKSLMEGAGAIPAIAEMVHSNRQVVIGYLHLTLLALITTYLFFAIYQYLLQQAYNVRAFVWLYVPATFLMVFTLFLDGLLQWLGIYSNGATINLWLALISAIVTISGIVVLKNVAQHKLR